MGYNTIRINGVRKIAVNANGKKPKKAFMWKVKGMKNEQINEWLEKPGAYI